MLKKILKTLFSKLGYDVQIRKTRIHKGTVIKYKLGEYILQCPSDHPLINTLLYFPEYSKNISTVSKIANYKYPTLHIIDIGANIGDTALLLRSEIDCPILSIEGDEEYYGFLNSNVKDLVDITTYRTFLDETDRLDHVFINKSNGSLNLSAGTDGEITSFLKLDTLLEKFPDFQDSKIVKIDTDGYDIKILKGSMEYIKRTRPIIFFEYDINFYTSASVLTNFITSLQDVGYAQIIIYDNFGKFMMSIDIAEQAILHHLTMYIKSNKTIYYYDFCMFHRDDIDVCKEICRIEALKQ